MYKNTDASPAQRAARHRVVVTLASRVDGGRDGRADEPARPVQVVEQGCPVHGLVGECRFEAKRAEPAATRRVLDDTQVLDARTVLEDLGDLQPDVEAHVAAPVAEREGVERALDVVGTPGAEDCVERPADDRPPTVLQGEDDEHPPPARRPVGDCGHRRIEFDACRRFGRRGLCDDDRRWAFGTAAATIHDGEQGVRAAVALGRVVERGIESQTRGGHGSSPR